MDLFEHQRKVDTAARAPLADRMRPRSLDEFVGQDHIIGPGRLLRRAIEADQLSSLIFHGPPGTGKTTLARIIANTTQAHFAALNAVLAGVKDIRSAVAEAEERRGLHGRRTILFVDEVHRFNKAQQDALLPWVENGTLILIGATTENPFFEVNKALVSRSRIFQLRPLGAEDLRAVARMALADPERGYGDREVAIDPDALEHLVDVANGDARALLNALELAVETTSPDAADRIRIDLAVAEESIQRRAVLYDKEGDAHFDTISAFIKSLRGSDPDAALYWLARMVYAGEDPRFIFRRMLILAAEDVGLADPGAIGVVAACAQAFDYVGLPEGQFHLAEATLYLATAPKSNSSLAYFDALEALRRERAEDVPSHLKDANRDQEGFGHGAGYLYPHAYRDHWVAQQYLPEGLQGRLFYQPSDQGYEQAIREATARRREAQLAAMLDDAARPEGEILSFTGALAGRERDRWLARSAGRAGERLAALRDRVLSAASPPRNGRLLHWGAGSGLLTWEALRRVPEGGVWTLARDPDAARVIEAQAAGLAEADRPVVLAGTLAELAALLALRGESDLRFEAIVGRQVLGRLPDEAERSAALGTALERLVPGGRLSLAEPLPGAGSRPLDLLLAEPGSSEAAGAASAHAARSDEAPEPDWLARARAAEAAALAREPAAASSREALVAALEAVGFVAVEAEVLREELALSVTPALVERWFGPGARFAASLAEQLGVDEIDALRARFAAMVGAPPRPWHGATVFFAARRA